MCQQHSGHGTDTSGGVYPSAAEDTAGAPFPWSVGVFDAHCHPTDTLASLDRIPQMKAGVLTVMATRSQDQSLVHDIARSPLAVSSPRDLKQTSTSSLARDQAQGPERGRVVPSFGWHPWFSHQLYDDGTPEHEQTFRPSADRDLRAAKHEHYAAVLQPSPGPDDTAFLGSLPDPAPLSAFISATRARLEENPLALVGEIGLDKAFRLPEPFNHQTSSARDVSLTPGGREGRLLSPHRVRMPHQIAVLKAQLALAGKLGRPVSVHGVQAHGVLHDTLVSCWKGHEKAVRNRRQRKQVAPGAEDFSSSSSSSSSSSDEHDQSECKIKGVNGDDHATRGRRNKHGSKKVPPKPYPPRICLHSYSGPGQMLKQYLHQAIPAEIFFSFSAAINLSTEMGAQKFEEALSACPDDRVLVESDLHVAGEEMDEALETICRHVCKVKGWELEDGVMRLRENYERFIFG